MAPNEYEVYRENLVHALNDFKRLEQDEPEVATRLGFAGYAQLMTLDYFGNEQRELLERIADTLGASDKR